MENSRNAYGLKLSDAIAGGLKRSSHRTLVSHHGHRYELNFHVAGCLVRHFLAQAKYIEDGFGKKEAEGDHHHCHCRLKNQRLLEHVIGVADLPSADGPGDHGAHTRLQAHAGGHGDHDYDLCHAQASDGLIAEPSRPKQVRDLIDYGESALRYLWPRQIPKVTRDAALGEVSRYVGTAPPACSLHSGRKSTSRSTRRRLRG